MAFSKHTTELITNFYRVLTGATPQTEISTLARLVDMGDRSLSDILMNLYQSPTLKSSGAEAITRIFYGVLGRAPDAPTYNLAMEYYNKGLLSLGQLTDIALSIPGTKFSSAALPDHEQFLNTAYTALTGKTLPKDILIAAKFMLQQGKFTRGDMVHFVLEQPDFAQRGDMPKQVQTSLMFLAATGREPTQAEIDIVFSGSNLPGHELATARSAAHLALVSNALHWPRLTYSSHELNESHHNNGTIPETLTLTIEGAKFAGDIGAELGTVTGIPNGMTATLVKTNTYTAQLTLSGTATDHTSLNKLPLTINLEDKDIEGATAKQVVGATAGQVTLNFADLVVKNDAISGELSQPLYINLEDSIATLGDQATFKVLENKNIVDIHHSQLSKRGYFDFSGIQKARPSTEDDQQGNQPTPPTASTPQDSNTEAPTASIKFIGYRNQATEYHASNLGDAIRTGNRSDEIYGGTGNDTINSGAGRDTVYGGAGDDVFIFDAAPSYARHGSSLLTIKDYGFGKDKLDFTRILGGEKAPAAPAPGGSGAPGGAGTPPAASGLTVIKAAGGGVTGQVIDNGDVVLVEANGRWLDQNKQAVSATAEDVLKLFARYRVDEDLNSSKRGDGLFAVPNESMRAVIITADVHNGADVWLLQKETGAAQYILESEIVKIGHIDGSWNTLLAGDTPITLA